MIVLCVDQPVVPGRLSPPHPTLNAKHSNENVQRHVQ